MRLRVRDNKTVYLKKRIVESDKEGNDLVYYSDDPVEIEMTVQAAGGKIMAAVYGEKLPYVKSCKYQGDELKENENELDGICLYVSQDKEPDYRIKVIQTFSTHLNVTLEKRDANES